MSSFVLFSILRNLFYLITWKYVLKAEQGSTLGTDFGTVAKVGPCFITKASL